MAEPLMDPRDSRWYRIGDYTLCETCGRAIQLRVEKIRGLWRPVALWVHLGPSIYHPAEPSVSWAEAAHRRDVRDGVIR